MKFNVLLDNKLKVLYFVVNIQTSFKTHQRGQEQNGDSILPQNTGLLSNLLANLIAYVIVAKIDCYQITLFQVLSYMEYIVRNDVSVNILANHKTLIFGCGIIQM